MIQPTRREIAIQILEAAKNDEPDLSSYYQFYQDLLQIQDEAESSIINDLEMVDDEALKKRAMAGLPQLSFDHLSVYDSSFRDYVQNILEILIVYQEEKVDRFPIEEENLVQMARERFSQTDNKDSTDLLGLAIDLALMPYIEHATTQIKEFLDKTKWLKQNCPACGGETNFACLDEKDGGRTLVCSRCRYQWHYKRTGCPYCQNSDPVKLRYYPAGEKKAYRLYVCDSCKRYLKAVDLRIAGSSFDLIAGPILTWSLDKAAREKGYR